MPVPSGRKAERGPALGLCLGEYAVHNLVRRSVAPNREEIPVALRIGAAGERCCLARPARLRNFEIDADPPNAIERRGCELAAASAAGRRIHDGEEASRSRPQNLRRDALLGDQRGTTASRPMAFRICSANSARLIFNDAVRGKSASQTRYPLTRL